MVKEMINVKDTDIFHVHTNRCGHAGDEQDEAYVQKAIELGVTGIWFSDHAPFPLNPFRGRMKMETLPEYLYSLFRLKRKYEDDIDIHIGLETEYFEGYDMIGYYDYLRSQSEIEFLLLGQHMGYDEKTNDYTFHWDKEKLIACEYSQLALEIVKGIQSGYFDAVAHPDRIYRRKKEWDPFMEMIAGNICQNAANYGIPLEKNLHSMKEKNQYWAQFWEMADDLGANAVFGYDAHSTSQMEKRHQRLNSLREKENNTKDEIEP